jgi:hypothetical protein
MVGALCVSDRISFGVEAAKPEDRPLGREMDEIVRATLKFGCRFDRPELDKNIGKI